MGICLLFAQGAVLNTGLIAIANKTQSQAANKPRGWVGRLAWLSLFFGGVGDAFRGNAALMLEENSRRPKWARCHGGIEKWLLKSG
jgi:hypothetical protein